MQNNKNYLMPFVITQNKNLTQTSEIYKTPCIFKIILLRIVLYLNDTIKVHITPFNNKSKLN